MKRKSIKLSIIALLCLSVFMAFIGFVNLNRTAYADEDLQEERNITLSKTAYKISISGERMLLVTAINNYDLAYEVGYIITKNEVAYEIGQDDTCETDKYYNAITSGEKTETALDIFGEGYDQAKLIIWEIHFNEGLSFKAYAKQGIPVEGGLQIPDQEINVIGAERNNEKYTITFDFADDRENQVVELYNGQKIEAPVNSVIEGYTCSWENIAEIATESITYTEVKTPKTDTEYTVKHFKQNLEDDNYTEVVGDVETLTGTTDADTNAQAKSYTGFTAKPISQLKIASDGTTVVQVKYDRNVYAITWKNGNTTLDTDNLKYGATPDYKGSTPQKASDETYSYTFSDWSPAIGVVTSNATYTAQFESAYINYSVKFEDDEGNVISEKTDYHYGDTLVVPSTDKASTADKDYEFVSFSPTLPETVTANAIYVATYKVWERIGTAEKFNSVFTKGAVLTKDYRLVADIDFGGSTIIGIGSASGSFSGTFDGQNHILSNIVLEGYGDWDYGSLFGSVKSTGLIKNLGVYNITTKNYSVGAIVNYLEGAIDNIVVYGTLGNSLRPVVSTSASLVVGTVTTWQGNGWISNVTAILKTHSLQDNAYAGILTGQYTGSGHIYNCTTVCLDETVKQVSAVTDIDSQNYSAGHTISTKVKGNLVYSGYLHEYANYAEFVAGETVAEGSLLEKVLAKGIEVKLNKTVNVAKTDTTFTAQLPIINEDPTSVKANGVEFATKNYDKTTGIITLDVATLGGSDKVVSVTLGNVTYSFNVVVFTQLISTPQQFNAIFTKGATIPATERIGLANDIDFTGVTVTGLGNSGVFNGVFDGQGYILSNISLTGYGDWDHDSLFGQVKGATACVKNVGIYNVTTNNYSDGVVSSWLEGGTIDNVVVYGTLGTSRRPVASTPASLLVNTIHGGTIKNSTVLLKTHTIQSTGYANTLVGQYNWQKGVIENCTSVCLDETVLQLSAVSDTYAYDYSVYHDIQTLVKGPLTFNGYFNEFANYAQFEAGVTVEEGSILDKIIDLGIEHKENA